MNRIILSGFVLSALLAFTFGEELCTPAQWEGTECSMGGYVHHRHPGIIKEMTFVSYDATNKRKASFINYHNNEYENKFQMIVRYGDDNDDGGKIYVVDLKKDKCWTKKLKMPFRKACIPKEGSKHLGDFSFGLAGKGGLPVSAYEVKKKDFEICVTVTKAGNAIIPITENMHGRFMDTAFIQGVGFSNITPGIKNATVFDIPKQCTEDDDVSISDYLMRKNFVLAF